MHKRILIGIAVVVGLGVVVAGLAGAKAQQIKAMGSGGMQAQTESVTTIKADSQTWNPTLKAVGTLTAENGVTLSAEVAGTVARIEFESGSKVTAGTLLAQLDVRVEEAQLKAAEARADLARINLDRVRELRSRDTLAQSELDSGEAELKQAQAEVERIRAEIEKKTFRAPFAGRLGIRKVNVGQYVNGGTAIVELQTMDPIHVDFTLPQRDVTQVAVGQQVEVTTDGTSESFKGKVTSLDPRVDPATRNLRIRATLTNTGERLRSGMFANVDVLLPAKDPVVVIPSSAVLFAPYGDSVFVVGRAKDESGKEVCTVRQQTVRLGATRGDFVAIVSGLQAGDEVVSTGAFKLRNGAQVTVNNEVVPPAQLAPTPANT